MRNKLVIIGLGNIGKRHLQAAAKVEGLAEIVGFDVSADAIKSIPSFCSVNGIKFDRIKTIGDRPEMLASIDPGAIVIVATTARGRVPLLEDIIARRPLAVIAEKPLCQNGPEYEKIIKVAADSGVNIYVNFPRHAFPAYRDIFNALDRRGRISFSARFPDGLACIGIHMFELMTWLLKGKDYLILNAKERGVYETKRAGYQDLDGDVALELNGKDLAFFSTIKEQELFSIRIAAGDKEFSVYESEKKLIIADTSGAMSIKEIDVFYVSQVSALVIEELIKTGRSKILPDIEGARLAHQILFESLEKSRLAGINIT